MTSRPSARYGVRTASEPMAFTAWELVRGATMAWVLFTVFAPITIVIIALGIELWPGGVDGTDAVRAFTHGIFGATVIAVMYVPWSLGALVVAGIPLAALLGRALRRTTQIATHLTCFAILGVLVGTAATLLALQVHSLTPLDTGWAIIVTVNILGTGAASAGGWWFTASRALRADAAAAQEVTDR